MGGRHSNVDWSTEQNGGLMWSHRSGRLTDVKFYSTKLCRKFEIISKSKPKGTDSANVLMSQLQRKTFDNKIFVLLGYFAPENM